ncbi:hypothetical protein ABZ371_32765 [Streptomyces sp. NPDC005899]|uniref:hypothetical protein n=1 Tax=Streptomyces sp. NPDC005899 TaxID=3155716 RepID=UPI00340739A0
MAKNKNRKQGGRPDRASAAERGTEETRPTAYESPAASQTPGSPSDVARKHQRRFGHN